MKRQFNFTLATITPLLFALCTLVGLSTAANAQHLVSTRAGFVNRADGKVFILRRDSEDGQPGRASLGTQMKDGDKLTTSADSRAEILLNPGSYLRLDQQSEVRAVSTAFSEIRFELLKGSAIVEVGQTDKQDPIEIITPNGSIAFAKDALVRLDAKTAATWVAVRQGEIHLGHRDAAMADKNTTKLKRGKIVRLTGGHQPEIAKIDKDAAADGFDTWSFNRAQTLVAANYSMLRRSSGNSLLSYGWVYDAFYGCYTFIPGQRLFYSPYGFGYYRSFGDCYCYGSPYYYGPYYGNGYGNNGGGGGMVTNVPARVLTGNDREPIRRDIPSNRGIVENSSRNSDRGDFGSRGISTAPSSTSAPVSMPTSAPARSDSGGGSMPSRGGDSGGSRPPMPERPPSE